MSTTTNLHPMIRPKVKVIPLDTWHQIPEFPKQRDTALRAAKAQKTYLSGEWLPTWSRVSAVLVENEDHLYKLDGHTRAYLWERDAIAKPADGKVTCEFYSAKTIEEAEILYDTFNSASSVKTKKDFIYGELRAAGSLEKIETQWILRANLAGALRIATGFSEPSMAAPLAIPALELLDAIHPLHGLFRSGILGACLLTIRAHGQEAIDQFWGPYNRKDFTRQGKKANAQMALYERLRDFQQSVSYGAEGEQALARYALHLYDKVLAGKTLFMVPLPMSRYVGTYIEEMRTKPSPRDWAVQHGLLWGN